MRACRRTACAARGPTVPRGRWRGGPPAPPASAMPPSAGRRSPPALRQRRPGRLCGVRARSLRLSSPPRERGFDAVGREDDVGAVLPEPLQQRDRKPVTCLHRSRNIGLLARGSHHRLGCGATAPGEERRDRRERDCNRGAAPAARCGRHHQHEITQAESHRAHARASAGRRARSGRRSRHSACRCRFPTLRGTSGRRRSSSA
jgi:hypothetical protein